VERVPERPWEDLEQLVKGADVASLEAYLDELPATEVARAVSRISDQSRTELFSALSPDNAAEVLQSVPDEQAVDWIEQLPPAEAAAIIEQLPSDEQADLLNAISDGNAEEILAEMHPVVAAEARALARYSDDTAGGLMATEYLAYPEDQTVEQVINDMRIHADRYRDYPVQYAYVTGEHRQLVGVLRLRDLLLAERNEPIHSLMIERPLTLPSHADLDHLRDFFDTYSFLGVPVTDDRGRLLGVLYRGAVDDALRARDVSDFRKSQGILQEEFRTMPLMLRARRRLSWLSVNIFLNVIAASVIAVYQDVLAQVIALAVFLPIISDMSGCSGGQAVAVSMRELSLGLARPHEVFRVWLQELNVGLINGVVLGLLIAAIAWVWHGNPYLGLVVGVALALNTVIAVSIGGTLPLLMRYLKLDPALASGPILTTITDMCGFFLILSLASILLAKLTTS